MGGAVVPAQGSFRNPATVLSLGMCLQGTIFGWVRFGEPQRSESAKLALESEGYRVETHAQEDGAVVLRAIPPEASLTPESLATRLRSLADDFGGEFTPHGGSEQIALRRHP